MISPETLQAVRTIIVHANCPDGVMSAILLKDALPDASVKFVQYGEQQESLPAEPHMLFCDFSPHPKRVREFVDAGAMVLDHHAGAKDVVLAFGANGCFADAEKEPAVSGAALAFREVWYPRATARQRADEFIRDLVRRVSLRDTWQTKDPEWQRATAESEALRFFEQESWLVPNVWAPERRGWWDARLGVGQELVQKHQAHVHRAVESAYRVTVESKRLALFQGVKLSSDAAEMLGESADLVVGFDYFGVENDSIRIVYSTRSHTGFDCASFCKLHGGGGHKPAAGFSTTFDPRRGEQDPYSLFIRLFRQSAVA